MILPVNDEIHLAEFSVADKPALVRHLNDREIYKHTLQIPHPYTEASADQWLEIAREATTRHGQPINWAIRHHSDGLIGGCGFKDFEIGESHRAEIGYWLARRYWGRGIMTDVVRCICRHGFDQFGLVKITAGVFSTNPASARVLEKCGFQHEGTLRKHYKNDGRLIDSVVYALPHE